MVGYYTKYTKNTFRADPRNQRGCSDKRPVPQDVLEVRVSDLVQLIPDVDDGLLCLQDAAQVDRRAAQHEVARRRIDRLLELLDLLRAVAHRGQDLPGVRILLVRLLDRTNGVADRTHDLRRAEPLRRDVR